ncbi:C4-dicarboxylate ABC transporter substrate-binding protein [Endozoicomonas sp. OPT23]|uniref:TRAP transporter substrate-binding protein n=1 Tax=Endozoicomonas sp. OPT23 TaxID=2072845 RepID=UPI00129B0AB8|nr:TRAP transporter substrate-binding protein [Endozoicomonas sp. OPT23]MRI34236.1 C4-dicarboxylate ABC transporter substrate-binding protein [Endozoicomonas sp. OPT23]
MKRLFRKVALTAAITGSILATSAQAEIRWDMPTPYVDSIHHTQNIREFVKDINAATKGELTINVHSGGSLFKHKEIPRAVRSGQVQIGEMLIGIMGNQNPIFKLDNLPFLATSFDQAEKLWQVSRPEVEKALDKEGMKLLYSVPWPPQGIYSKNKIADVKDLNSTKMRAYSATTSRLAVLLGASPTTVQTVEVPQAFSTGIIDTMITSPSTGVSSQAWDYVNNYTDVQAWLPKNMVVVNKRAFRRLPKELQNSIVTAAKAAEQRGWDKARKETAQKTAELSNNGIQVALPTEHLMEQLNQVGETMTSEWLKESGSAGQTVISAYKK